MKIRNILILALSLTLPLAACDSGDDGDSSDSNAESNESSNDTTGEDTSDSGAADVDCQTFCTSYVDLCLQTGKSTEFELFDDCNAACAAWDQAGVNCRNEQIIADACDQAGNMGSTCM